MVGCSFIKSLIWVYIVINCWEYKLGFSIHGHLLNAKILVGKYPPWYHPRLVIIGRLYRSPLVRDCHKVALHRVCKSRLVQRRLDDRWGFAAHHHWQTLSNTFHLFQNVVLSHKVNDTDNQLLAIVVHTNQN
jgi:hypothetical protein